MSDNYLVEMVRHFMQVTVDRRPSKMTWMYTIPVAKKRQHALRQTRAPGRDAGVRHASQSASEDSSLKLNPFSMPPNDFGGYFGGR